MENQLAKFAKLIVASRVVARAIIVTTLKMSASAKAPARQSTLAAALRAKTGGKGIRTPDLLIANETLYQLSYTPQNRRKIITSIAVFIKHCPPIWNRLRPQRKILVSMNFSDTIGQRRS